MIISERIFEIMKEQKMSQRELSRRTGITISTISDWNTKKSNPASDKLLVISEALGVSVEELLQNHLKKIYQRILSIRMLRIIRFWKITISYLKVSRCVY